MWLGLVNTGYRWTELYLRYLGLSRKTTRARSTMIYAKDAKDAGWGSMGYVMAAGVKLILVK